MSKTIEKITISLDLSQKEDSELFTNLSILLEQFKKNKITKDFSKQDILKYFLNTKATQSIKKRIKEDIVSKINEDLEFDCVYSSYVKEKNLNITEKEFSLRHLHKISSSQRRRYVDQSIGL